jgi:hypothetical protein
MERISAAETPTQKVMMDVEINLSTYTERRVRSATIGKTVKREHDSTVR